MFRHLVFICSLFFLSACSTPEYKKAEGACSQIAYSKYPVSVEQYSCRRMRYIEVPTGETVCTADVELGKTVTRCKEVTERKSDWYDSTCTGDVNLKVRREWITECTWQACYETFGNVSCKTN